MNPEHAALLQRYRLRWRRLLRYVVQRVVLRALVTIYTRTSLRGRRNIAGIQGPFVLVANHCSHLDTAVIVARMPYRVVRRLAVGAAADHFYAKRFSKLATTFSFNAYPIHRQSGGDQAQKGLSRRLLANGVPLLIYPEGTRSRTGTLGPFRPGAAALCVEASVPCIPLLLRGTDDAMPVGRSWPRPGRPRVRITIGTPLRPRLGEDPETFNARIVAAVAAMQHQQKSTARRRPVPAFADSHVAAVSLEVS